MPVYTATSVGSSDTIARAYLQVELDKITDDPANNRSYVRIRGRMGDNSASFGGNGTCSWVVKLDSVEQGSGSFPYNYTGDSGQVNNFFDQYYWITHSTDGTKTISGFVEVNPFNSFIQPFNVSGPLVLTDYNRSPTYASINVPVDAAVGISYSGQVTANNASGYSIFSGSLPTGLALNTSTGQITGIPISSGVFTFTIRATGTFEGSVDTTQVITVVGGAKAWNGTNFAPANVRIWNGTQYSNGTIETWNGSGWINSK
jgi:hypothetical protein